MLILYFYTSNMLETVMLCRVVLFGFVVSTCVSAQAQPKCDTALGRIARKAADDFVRDHQSDACAGFKAGAFALDNTKELEIQSFQLCEDADLVTANASIRIECATSDAAFVKSRQGDSISASISVDLRACEVKDASITADGFLLNVGFDLAGIRGKMKEAAAREIKNFCSK